MPSPHDSQPTLQWTLLRAGRLHLDGGGMFGARAQSGEGADQGGHSCFSLIERIHWFRFGSTSRNTSAASRSMDSVVSQSTQASVTEQP